MSSTHCTLQRWQTAAVEELTAAREHTHGVTVSKFQDSEYRGKSFLVDHVAHQLGCTARHHRVRDVGEVHYVYIPVQGGTDEATVNVMVDLQSFKGRQQHHFDCLLQNVLLNLQHVGLKPVHAVVMSPTPASQKRAP